MVDMRFGPGTWKGIVAERAKRIQAAKEAAAAARREEFRKQEEMMENIKLGALLTGVVAITIAFFILMLSTIASGLVN